MEKQVFTIDEFCQRNGISRFTYHKLKNQGRGPREMALGGVIRITPKAEADWQRAREMPKDAEARLIERERQHRQRISRTAAKSPKHVSKAGPRAGKRRR